jgi:anti-sigma regulatory factor (Ser/Thr protein kinase)
LVVHNAPSVVAPARHWAVASVKLWGITDGGVHTSVEIIVSELLSNGVRHTSGRLALTLRCVQRHGVDRIRIEVHDTNVTFPRRGEPNDDAESGRGLLLVQSLTSAFGWASAADGKVVWAELDLPEPAGRPGNDGAVHGDPRAVDGPGRHVAERLDPGPRPTRLHATSTARSARGQLSRR